MGEEGEQEKKEEFFVQISDPIEMRRGILESSKSLLKCMQSYEKVSAIRTRKTEAMAKLRSFMKETSALTKKFKRLLPRNQFTPLPARFMAAKLRAPTGDEVLALESELEKIEEKLSEMVD